MSDPSNISTYTITPIKNLSPSQNPKNPKKAQKVHHKNRNFTYAKTPSKKPPCVSGVYPRGVVARVCHVQNQLR